MIQKFINQVSKTHQLKVVNKCSTAKQITDYPKRRDHVLRAFSNKHLFRISFVDSSQSTTQSVINFKLNEEKQIKTLSKCFSTSLMISSFLKNEERIKSIIAFQVGEKHYDFYAESMANGEIRGFSRLTQIQDDMTQQPTLVISNILENQTSERISSVPLQLDQSNEWIQYDGESLTQFYQKSEQIPTVAEFYSDIQDKQLRSLGFLIQILPGGDEELIQEIRKELNQSKEWQYCIDNKLSNVQLSEFFKNHLQIDDLQFRRNPVDFYCRCKKDDFKRILLQLGLETIQDMKEKNDNVLVCNHCNKNHELDENDFQQLISQLNQTIQQQQ